MFLGLKEGPHHGDQVTFLKSRAELCFRLYRKHQTGVWLWRWFEAEMHVLQAEGLVDMHTLVFSNRDTTTQSVATVLANVLCQRRMGLCQVTVVD